MGINDVVVVHSWTASLLLTTGYLEWHFAYVCGTPTGINHPGFFAT